MAEQNNLKEKYNIQNALALLILNLFNDILTAYFCSDIFSAVLQHQSDSGIKTVIYAGMTMMVLNIGFGIILLWLSARKFMETRSFNCAAWNSAHKINFVNLILGFLPILFFASIIMLNLIIPSAS